MAEQSSSDGAASIAKIFRNLEVDIPHIDGIEERSLEVFCDGKSYSVAQLWAWTKRVIPKTDKEREIVWKFTRSSRKAVRYIACCALCVDGKIEISSFPEDISIFHAMEDKESEKFKNLIAWLEKHAIASPSHK